MQFPVLASFSVRTALQDLYKCNAVSRHEAFQEAARLTGRSYKQQLHSERLTAQAMLYSSSGAKEFKSTEDIDTCLASEL